MHKPFKEKCNLREVEEPYAKRNVFKKKLIHIGPLPKYKKAKDVLPQPIWEGHEDYIRAYDFAWKTAFGNLKNPTPLSRFKSQFIDTAFNGFSFMWDSAFMMMFGKYGTRAFDFQKTLDNFYACQHGDGFIGRELWEKREGERFDSYDPVSTGPNVLPWAEWEYFLNTGDKKRLQEIFDPLMGYHRWLRANRTWRDGTYWNTGWGCGMDNQPRVPEGCDPVVSHGHGVWADACFQMILSCKVLIAVGKIIGRENETEELKNEAARLTEYVNETLWDEEDGYYYDLWRVGGKDAHSKVKTIGAYWALLADVVPEDRKERFIAHLDNPKEFKRPNRVPSLSADHPQYNAKTGEYWLGGVWAPTDYMVIRGLQKNGYYDLAYDIASATLNNVIEVFRKTKTLWENYAPERASQGKPAKKDFVGWSGLFPITFLFEGIFGLEPDVLNNKIVWRIREKETHGVKRYPLSGGTCDLLCVFENGVPNVTVKADFPVTVEVIFEDKHFTVRSF